MVTNLTIVEYTVKLSFAITSAQQQQQRCYLCRGCEATATVRPASV